MIEWTPTAPNTAHFTVEGRLDAHEAPQLRDAFHAAQQQGHTRYYVSMDRVDFMDSAGLAAIVSGLKAARQQGGELFIVQPSAMVQKVLELTLLNQVIPVTDSPEGGQAGRG